MQNNDMQEQIHQAKHLLSKVNLPRLPEEIILLQKELALKYPNTVNIANYISRNPELLADFLELVNSSVMANKEPIKEARGAVNAIGLEEIYNLYFSAAIMNLLAQTYNEKQIIQQGVQAGLAASELSYWIPEISRSEAYFLAVLHNIGAVFMTRVYPDDYYKLFEKQLANPVSRFQEEETTYHTNHALVGTLIGKKWHLDCDINNAILFHHCPKKFENTQLSPKSKQMIALLWLSNFLVSQYKHEQYRTKELDNLYKMGKKYLNLPENAIQAGAAVLSKWGNSSELNLGSH